MLLSPLPDPSCAPPVLRDAGMPVPACLQHPALSPVLEPGHAMEEPAGGGAEPWAEGLCNSNNNASPGGWPGGRGGHPLAPFGGPGAEPSYLGRVVLEIVESERTYARDLRSIVEGYLGKIIDAEEPVLRPEQVSALFGNIEDIYELSSTLLQNLESCANDPVAVAVCFVTRSQEFAIYTQYCNNYPSSVAALAECMRSKPQARFLRECQERLRHALPLGAYLLKPVQRILKYHLLLQEIAKHFEHKSGDDYEVVLEAIDTMTCVAWYINDMKRKHEHAIRQQEIQSLLLGWKGPDLTSYGELVLEGTFRVQRVRHERAVFLFDKTLLITKRRGDHYVYKSHIPCSSLMLIESTRDSLCFSLAHYKHGKQQHSLQAKSVEEKRVWTHHIKRLILENHHAIIPQKVRAERDGYPPRLPRCSPEHLKKSWSCQPLADPAAELRQGRRQSGESRTSPASPPPLPTLPRGDTMAGSHQCPSGWWALGAGGHPLALEGPKRPSSWGPGSCEKVSAALQLLPGSPEGPSTHLPAPPQASSTGEHPEGPGAPEAPSSAGTPAPVLPGGEREPERAAEDLQGLSSEEEEEEEEEGAASSILPPSVLDQASVIAERFGGGGSFSCRSSLALEGRPASRSGSALSLDGAPQLEAGEPGGSRSTVPSPEPLAGARRESLLSSRDRLLLDKIKSYYGHAEHQDASFSVRRRESLSFIPKGLVRSSICRLNGLPRPPAASEPPTQPAPEGPEASPEEPCQENGLQPLEPQPPEPLLILEEDDLGTGGEGLPAGPPPRLLLTPPHPGTKVYQLARQYSLRIKSRRAGARCPPAQPEEGDLCTGTPSVVVPRHGGLAVAPSPGVPRSPSSPGNTEPFTWPDVRELRARFGAPRPPPVSRSRSAPDGPCRGGRPAEKERGSGRSRSAEAGGGPSTPEPAPARHSSDGALWVAAEAPLGPGQRVLVLEQLPAPAEPPTYVQIRSPTTREKICLKAVVERCKAYQASEEYRRRCPEPLDTPEPPRHGLVRDLRQKFQTLDAAS
uniref:Pleckstrin homology and RhoGEF domain containing G3 n=1 Tax=Falco tinnunculus TaxID=100819 RepID=A0A8C4UR01_FALTI